MANSEFTFKQFTIKQDRCAMKVGTDGVLLGAWADGGHNILDIGTGTALIALMMAQRFKEAHITAIEIDGEASRQARENVEASPFANRVEVLHTALQDFVPGCQYDCIVTNPPYFTDSLKNPDSQRAAARHTDALPYRDLFGCIANLLAPDGTFSAIIPTDCLDRFTAEAYLSGLSPIRRCAIKTTTHRPPKRQLVAFAHNPSASIDIQEAALQTNDGNRSEWYSKLTEDFYIR